MILLSNQHVLEYVIASGALGFGPWGWWWEWLLVKLGFIRPELFTVFIRTLTRRSRFYPISNFSWIRPWTWLPFSPWSCIRLIFGGAINKVGLWNPGIDYWCEHIAPYIDFRKYKVAGSIYGNGEELVYMAEKLNQFDLVALEVNDSCPNTGHALENAQTVIDNVKRVKQVSRHPIIVKVSVAQNYLAIAAGLVGIAEAISLNSVPWEMVFPKKKSPLSGIGGTESGGGVSGKPAQKENWGAVEALAKQGCMPVIIPSIMEFEDMKRVEKLVAGRIPIAKSFGAIHLPDYPAWENPWTVFTNPCKPTWFVLKEKRKHENRQTCDSPVV